MKEVIAMFKWLKENEDVHEADMNYFLRLAGLYFEDDIKSLVNKSLKEEK